MTGVDRPADRTIRVETRAAIEHFIAAVAVHVGRLDVMRPAAICLGEALELPELLQRAVVRGEDLVFVQARLRDDRGAFAVEVGNSEHDARGRSRKIRYEWRPGRLVPHLACHAVEDR